MTIWLLVLVLMAAVAALGFRQGAIRVGFSLVGLVLAAFLAVPLGRLLRPALGTVGVKNPALAWILGPFVVFVVISLLFKLAAFTVHHKVDVYYKYKAGDLRLALWERLNHRLGLCLGLLNGAAYAVLISFVIYVLSYWTVQTGTGDTDPKSIQILNRLGNDLQATRFHKVARAIDSMSENYYDSADIAGLVYNNPLLEARLSRYPGFLSLSERQEFQDLANDPEFAGMRQRREPVRAVLHYPKVEAIVHNPDLLKTIWSTLTPDLKDLRAYLETGRSAKYDDEKILGRWKFSVNSALALTRKNKPNASSTEMLRLKKWMMGAFEKTTFVAMVGGQAVVKQLPPLKVPAGPAAAAAAAAGPQTFQGQWKGGDGKYQLNFSGGGGDLETVATVEGDRMSMTVQGVALAFDREI
jgi:uncharacterized membrane protein required for colicin V production